MSAIDPAELKDILAKHKLWRAGSEGGVRADLSGSDLRRANLRGSDLSDSDLSGCDLCDSNLSYSNLSGSNLSGAYLRGCNLSDSNLSYSNLSGCNLSGSDLSRADLRGSDLSRANLRGCNLSGSDLRGCNLSGSDLRGCNLSRANLSYSNLSGCNLSGAYLPKVAVEKNLPGLIMERVRENPTCLDMTDWHSCATTHCLAGWAVTLHSQGPLLESMIGTNSAGALIFNACCGEAPDFFSSESAAIEWLKKMEAKAAS